MKNRDLWAKVVVRENGVINRQKTVDALDTFMALQDADETKVDEVIQLVLKECSTHSHLTGPILLHSVCSRIAGNSFDQWPTLTDIGKAVLESKYTTEKGQGKGIKNPFYVAPAPAE